MTTEKETKRKSMKNAGNCKQTTMYASKNTKVHWEKRHMKESRKEICHSERNCVPSK